MPILEAILMSILVLNLVLYLVPVLLYELQSLIINLFSVLLSIVVHDPVLTRKLDGLGILIDCLPVGFVPHVSCCLTGFLDCFYALVSVSRMKISISFPHSELGGDMDGGHDIS